MARGAKKSHSALVTLIYRYEVIIMIIIIINIINIIIIIVFWTNFYY